MIIGLLHPGEMGAAVGASLVRAGHRVLWASEGRSPDTVARAAAAGLEDAGTVSDLASVASPILSVCPPQAAVTVARLVADAAAGREGWTYVDANAIAPGTAAVVAGLVEGSGGAYIDGGIIGPPPLKAGTTRLYLSGPAAIGLSATIATTEMEIHVVDDSPYAASALKLSYAAWTKGSAALLLSAWAAATRSGVDTALLEEWRTSRPGLPAELSAARLSSAAKGWRWAAEMEEIATMFDSLGLPPGFHQAAATVFSDPT